ncbi:MAG: hypothetical protein WCK35_27120 [Chloroflexota bacterium]
MSKTWKWILGILIVVIVVAAIISIPLVMRSYMVANNGGNTQALPSMPGQNGWQHPAIQDQRGNFDGRSMGGGRMFNRDGRFGGRFMPFGFGIGFMLLGGLLRLLPLALFGLLLYGMYQLGKRSGLRTTATNTVATPVPVVAPAPENNETPVV